MHVHLNLACLVFLYLQMWMPVPPTPAGLAQTALTCLPQHSTQPAAAPVPARVHLQPATSTTTLLRRVRVSLIYNDSPLAWLGESYLSGQCTNLSVHSCQGAHL
jgi:hypothetical protein